MKLASFEAIVQALKTAEVRFIVVGGIAVIAHGYGRNTRDVDIVVRLEPPAIANAFAALQKLGYQPRVPITAAQFADASLRAEWIREKGMKVLNFCSDAHRETPVDLFITEPFDFEEEYQSALVQEVAPAISARILRLESLLRMKTEAGRSQDLADVDELNLLHGRESSYDR